MCAGKPAVGGAADAPLDPAATTTRMIVATAKRARSVPRMSPGSQTSAVDSRSAASAVLRGDGRWVRADDHRVGDGDDLVDRQPGPFRVRTDRLRARSLVDADGSELA